MSAGQQRRGIDRATTPGRCPNLDYCSVGMQRLQVRVPISQPFVCPECSSPLRPPSRMAREETRVWLLPVNVWIMAAGMLVSGAGGVLLGRSQAPPSPRPSVSAASPKPAPAAPPVPVAPPHPAEPALSANFGAPALPAALTIQERPYPARLAPLEQVAPEHRLPNEVRSGQVAIDCLVGSALFHPACQVASARGTDAFSGAALAWLEKLPVRYAAGPHGTAPVALDHRWRVVFEDFSAAPPGPDRTSRLTQRKR